MIRERRKKILEIIEDKGFVKVVELSKLLDCSEVTLRNDIKQMDKEGLLLRTHGGAMKVEEEQAKPYNYEKIAKDKNKKIEITRAAYELINNGDTIIIDDATTSFYLTKHIKANSEKKITVVTNSLLVATELLGQKQVNLFMIGGQISSDMAATMGDLANSNIEGFHVDKAFIGVHGLNFSLGITSIGSVQLQVKKSIINAANEVIVLADSSKFGGAYLSVICPMDRVSKVITDKMINPAYIKLAKENHVDLIIAE